MKEKMICRGDLFYYDFGDNSGSVQSGERLFYGMAQSDLSREKNLLNL